VQALQEVFVPPPRLDWLRTAVGLASLLMAAGTPAAAVVVPLFRMAAQRILWLSR
jgi:hypothetical protein